MEFINAQGRHVGLPCQRCRRTTQVNAQQMRLDPTPPLCGDCQHALAINPDMAAREFAQAVRRSEEDSRAMRARWAAQDAAKAGRTA